MTSVDEEWPSKVQNRFADAKLALRGSEVSRRDGLSSWIVILYGPVGMLSGSWDGTYVYFVCRKVTRRNGLSSL